MKGVYENSDSVATPMMYANAKVMSESVSGGGIALDSATIQSGQNEIKVEVTLTYEVK